MSIKLMSQVWERQMSHAQQSVLLALVDHANDDGTRIHPSYGRIAWKTGYSRRQVKRIIADLIKLGAILRLERGGPVKGVNTYQVRLNVLPEKPPFMPTRGGVKMSPHQNEVVSNATRGGVKRALGGDIAMSPESPSESPYKSKSARKTRSVPRSGEEKDKTAEKIRTYLRDLAKTSYGRDAPTIAHLVGCTVAQVERELETLQ